jgi:hypothetical protein
MTDILNLGQEVELTGKSGATYRGRILDKGATTLAASPAIACLSNSYFANGAWHHQIRDVFDTKDESETVAQFKHRDDISHLILIPRSLGELGQRDKIQDLIQQYIHR